MGHFTLTQESQSIRHLTAADDRLSTLIRTVGDLHYSLDRDPFSAMVETIAGQMVSEKVAVVFASRLHDLCGGKISLEAICALTKEDLRSTGISNSKAEYILGLAEAVNNGTLNFAAVTAMTDDEALKQLTSLKGIGTWTAKMHLIFVLGRENILPFEDGAFLQTYSWLYNDPNPSVKNIRKQVVCWEPYCSIAARYLYRALDTGLTKQPNPHSKLKEHGLQKDK